MQCGVVILTNSGGSKRNYEIYDVIPYPPVLEVQLSRRLLRFCFRPVPNPNPLLALRLSACNKEYSAPQ